MESPLPTLGLLAFLIALNGLFAGSEIALISLREGQLQRLEDRSRNGRVLARLARDPNRFLATIQVGITLAGFLASAVAAITLAEPLVLNLEFLGSAARPAAIVLVTSVLTFVTLVVGELAPKRVAMQRAQSWGLLVARPLDLISRITRPAIWLLGRTTDLVVRLLGGDPTLHRDQVTEEELRDLVAIQIGYSEEQRTIISEALEIGDRTLGQVLVPRRDVFCLSSDLSAAEALRMLVASGHSRAPVVRGDLDEIQGVVNLRVLFGEAGLLADHIEPALELPESLSVVEALRALQSKRQHLAVVVDEHGGVEGIVTLEDFIEELVGEIYDETDSALEPVVEEMDGSVVVPGSFPIHELVDLDIDAPEGSYTTVAGLILEQLGYLPRSPGDTVEVAGRRFEVVEVEENTISRIRVHPPSVEPDGDPA